MATVNGTATITHTTFNGIVTTIPALAFGSNSSWAQTKDLDLGYPFQQKYIDAIRFDIEVTDGGDSSQVTQLTVEVGWRDKMGDSINWNDPEYLTLDNPIIYPRVTGRYILLKFEDQLAIQQWELGDVEFYGNVISERL